MPKPVYIVCAENVTVDRETNLVSISNVIEKISSSLTVRRLPEGQQPTTHIHTGKAKAVATWAVVRGDEGKKFESQFLISTPDDVTTESQITPFEFEKGKLLHRFILTLQIGPIQKSGILKIENAVRKQGTNTWQRQIYEIVIEATIDDMDRLLPQSVDPERQLLHKPD